MRVCVYGAGAIGGMIGFLLKRQGVDVTLIARRDHYKEIKNNGLTFISKEYDIEETKKFAIFENLDNLGFFDLVINSLKAHSANQTAEIFSRVSGLSPATIFIIVSSRFSLSPGFILSGEYPT